VIHLSPAHRRTLAPDAVVLHIRLAPAKSGGAAQPPAGGARDERPDSVLVTVDDDQIVVQYPGRIAVIPLGNRTVRDVINQLTADVPLLEVTSDYPLFPASYIGSTRGRW
jgi:hypothetical protein